MTCAKKHVLCQIICRDGSHYSGSNSCEYPQKNCPRLDGEGYEKCKSICLQHGHAEEVALEKAKLDKADLKGATIYLYGIDNFCKSCQRKLLKAGVRTFVFVD